MTIKRDEKPHSSETFTEHLSIEHRIIPLLMSYHHQNPNTIVTSFIL